MAVRAILSRVWRFLPLASVTGLLLAALYLVASVERESDRLGNISLLILLLTAVALLVLLAAIGARLARLLGDLRRGAPGARLRARLVAVFIALALPPVVIVYLFSVEFLDNAVEGWFDTGAEPALADAIELGQLFLDLRTRRARDEIERIAQALPPAEDEDARIDYLFRHVSTAGPVELSVLTAGGRVETLVHIDPQRMVADLPSAFALAQVTDGQPYSTAEAGGETLRIRVLTPLAENTILQGIFPLPREFSPLAERIERAYFRYENIAFLRQRLQQSFVLILSLVLGITALLAMLLAFNAARRLVRPIRDLAEATDLMRAGHFPDTLDVQSRDELGFLVESFNSMARELNRTQQKLESQRKYLETVLGRLSAGVIAFDGHHRLAAANRSAEQILGAGLSRLQGLDLDALRDREPRLGAFFDLLARRLDEPGTLWREEIKLEDRQQTLALVCRGSTLPDPEQPGRPGHVVVFDDVTMLDQAQRQAAWAELARRLAHEIKNPLTPIRLAAERLQLRLSSRLDADDARLLDRASSTIIHQVDALRGMVDAFGDYARPGPVRREPLDLADVIDAVVALWSAGDSGVTFRVRLDHADARPLGDAGQMQQVLNNLVQNAREAHPDGHPRLDISTSVTHADDTGQLVLDIVDDGPGFDPDILPRVFEPYASTKPRGTGLGLAIVQRIVDQMGGQIQAGNADGGGHVRITLPLAAVAEADDDRRR